MYFGRVQRDVRIWQHHSHTVNHCVARAPVTAFTASTCPKCKTGMQTRALGTTVVIVGMQWAVIVYTADPRAWGVVLGVPALFAGSAIARMFSVTEILHAPGGQGGRR